MSDIAKELDDVLKSRQTNGYHIRRIAGQARDEIERLREALGALGVVGNGYCFCSHDRDPDKAGHQPECRDALAARLADAVAALREIAHAHDTDARGLRFMAADALIAHNAIVSATPNQCDGCARGLPLVDGIHRGEGYDLIGCTADRYTDSASGVTE